MTYYPIVMIGKFIRELHRLATYVNTRPSINYGSIMALRCVGINDDYTMSMPLQVNTPFAADYDKICPAM